MRTKRYCICFNYIIKITFFSDQEDLDIPEEIQQISKNPIYKLKVEKNKNKNATKIELERLDAIKKCLIQVHNF